MARKRERDVAGIIAGTVVVLVLAAGLGIDLPNMNDVLREAASKTTAEEPSQEGPGQPAPHSPTAEGTVAPRASSPAAPDSSRDNSLAVAERRLNTLAVNERHRGESNYERDRFGEPWADIDDDGCNQRDQVLLRDARKGTVKVARQGSCDHDVLAGTWDDPYTGQTLTFTDLKDPQQAQALQVDHVVPLSEAWKSGADAWTDQRREQYANTLSVLLAVDGPANMSKGDQDPASWRPRKAYQCTYAIRWIKIKHAWALSIDAPEKRALRQMLDFCR